jgi:1,2-diacylglycerol 3-beta-galactosyltransferase
VRGHLALRQGRPPLHPSLICREVRDLINTTQRTILFLIADTGAGHRSAANAISNAIRLIEQREQEQWRACHGAKEDGVVKAGEPPPPTYRIEIVDVFEGYSRFPLREVVKLYGPTIRYTPRLFGEFFHSSNREETVMALNTIASPLILNGLLRLFTTVQPDIIVSIHPIINFVTIRVIRELGLRIPFLTVVTDLVSVHYAWFAPGADAYIVPTEHAKKLYLKRGLDPERVHLLGMPIDPKFTRPVASKEELQRKLGLKPGLPVVLLVGGGDGAGGLPTAVRTISQAHLAVQLLVVTGRNRNLYALLQRTRSKLHVPAKIFGFVQNMPELMHASDVIVTKAGPGTICEALACDLPLILSGYVPGQEEGNVEYVTENGVGVLALRPGELISALRRILKPGSLLRQRLLENARRIKRPEASFDIARCILSFLPPPGEPSVWQSPHSLHRQQMMSGRLRSAIRIHRLRTPLPKILFAKSPLSSRLARLRARELTSEKEEELQQ